MITLNWTLLVAATVFLVTLFALSRLLFRPLFRILEERRARTSDVQQRAREAQDQYQSLLEHYQEKIKEEKQQGYKLAESVRSGALQERQATIAEARVTAESLGQKARDQIRGELASAHSQLKREAEGIARTIMARVLGRA